MSQKPTLDDDEVVEIVLTIKRHPRTELGTPWTESICIRHHDGKQHTVHLGSNVSFTDLCKKVGGELLGVLSFPGALRRFS